MMEQDTNLTKWQRLRTALVCWLWINGFTASAIQHFTEMSLLLKIYNWLLGIGIAIFFLECGLKGTKEKKPIKFSKPLVILGWIIGIFGVIICLVYDEYVYDVVNTFGSRHHARG